MNAAYCTLITLLFFFLLCISITTPVAAVDPPEFISVSIDPQALIPGQNFKLHALASNTTNYTWQELNPKRKIWVNSCVNVTNESIELRCFKNNANLGTHYQRVIASGPGGSKISDPIKLTLHSIHPRQVTNQKIDIVDTTGFYNFIHNLTPDTGDPPNIEGVLASLVKPFTDQIGAFFYLIIFAVPYLIIWLRQKNLIVPSIIGILFGSWMLVKVPTAYTMPAVAILAFIIAGGLYSLYVKRP